MGKNPKTRAGRPGHPGENPEDGIRSEYRDGELRVWDPAAGERETEQCIMLHSSPSQEQNTKGEGEASKRKTPREGENPDGQGEGCRYSAKQT